jgi:N-acetylmuramoyl-L-alanine amidase
MLEVKRRLLLNVVGLALIFCLAVRPSMNAPDVDDYTSQPRSLAQSLFFSADQMSRELKHRPYEARSESDYRRAVEAYKQVARLGTSPALAALSLVRAAELLREMADNTGDGMLYQQAVALLRRSVADYPNSSCVGQALIGIAQIYEENLQDLDSAAEAYRQLIDYYPCSVMAREARAVLARFESRLNYSHAPADVIALVHPSAPELINGSYLINVRSFSGPDYARIVLDLSGEVSYTVRRAEAGSICLLLSHAIISPSLYGRRFHIAQSGLLKRITVSDQIESAVQVKIEVGSHASATAFRLSDPERIVVDLAAVSRNARPPGAGSIRQSQAFSKMGPLFSLPEITEPIVPYQHEATAEQIKSSSTELAPSASADSKVSANRVRCIVIDPGHGGHDTGTIGASGLREKDLTLDLARRLRAYIKRRYPDIEVVLTRDSDHYVALEERIAIANSRRADLFISIHANASPSRIASGVETFFVSPDRAEAEQPSKSAVPAQVKEAASNASANVERVVASVQAVGRIAASRDLARYIQAGLVNGIGAASPRAGINRGVKHAPFAVLVGATMPSVLAEVSFVSNPRDENLLQTSQFRERIAASLFAGLSSYIKFQSTLHSIK